MAGFAIQEQTLVSVQSGSAAGYFYAATLNDVIMGTVGQLYSTQNDPIYVIVVATLGNRATLFANGVAVDTTNYGPLSGAKLFIPAQYVDGSALPPTAGGVAVAAGTNTASSGTVQFSNSNGVQFGLNTNNVLTASVLPGADGIGAIAAGGSTFASGTVPFGNANGLSFITSNGSVVGSYTVPADGGSSLFSNSNNVTFGTNGSTVTASASFPAQTVQPVAASGSNGSFAFSTLSMGNSNGLTFYTTNGSLVGSYTVPAIPGATVFSNSNNVTFGLNGSTVTATATFAQSQQPMWYAASGSTTSSNTIVFGNTNGISFSTSNGSLVGTVKTDYQSSNANYLTSQSNQAVSGSNGSVTFQTLSFTQANGATFYTSANSAIALSYTVPTQTVQPVAVSGSNGSFAFSTLTMGNSNGLTFYTTNGSVVGSYTVPTVPGATVFSNSNNVTFGLNGSTITATATFAGAGGAAISAAGGSQNTGTVIFSNSNGISFGYNAGTITATVNPGAAAGIAAIGAGTQTATSGTVVFSNSNNVSFTFNGSTQLVASASFNQTVQPVAISGSNGSFAFSTVTMGNSNGLTFYTTNGSIVGSYTVPVVPGATVFSNSNNVSFGLAGSTVTATATFAQSQQPMWFAASGSTTSSNTIVFGNTNGISFSTSNGSLVGTVKTDYQSSNANYLTSQSNQAVSGTNGSVTFQTLSFTQANGASFYTSANSAIALSYTVPTQTVQPVAISGSNGSFAFSTVTMGASNGLTFYTTNGSIVGSYTVPTIPGATVFSNSNNVTFGLNGSTITASASFTAQSAQPVAYAVGGTTNNFSTIAFANSNGVTFSTGIQGVFATVKTDYQSSNANYLTSQSNQAISGSNGSFAFQTLTMGASNGLTFYTTNGSIVGSYTVPAGGNPFSAGNSTDGLGTTGLVGSQIVFFEGANITLSQSINGGSASLSIIAGGGGAGVAQAAGTQTATSGTVQFVNSNNFTFGMSNSSQITASFSESTHPHTWNVMAAGTQTANSTGTVQMVNSNNFTFGMTNSSQITASFSESTHAHTWNVMAAGMQTANTTGTVQFVNSNNFTFGMTNSSQITASFSQDHYNNIAATNGTAVTDVTVVFSNSNNVTFGIGGANNSVMTASASFPAQTQFVLSNSNNITFGTNASTVTASVGHTGPTGVIINASASTLTIGNLGFSNSNGIVWGWNGSTITADVSASVYATGNTFNAASTAGTIPIDSYVFSGAGGVSMGVTGGTVVISGANGTINMTGAIAVPGSTITNGTAVFSNSNGMVFGLNGSTMTVGQATRLTYQNRQLGASTTIGSALFQTGQLWLAPFRVEAPVSGSTLQIMQSFTGSVSSATTGTYGQTFNLAIYSQHSTDANRFDTWWSTAKTMSVAFSNTSAASYGFGGANSNAANSTIITQNVYGMRILEFAIGSTVPAGLYIFGMQISSSSAQYSGAIGTARGIVFDAPMPLNMGLNFATSVQSTLGYVDAGTWTSQTTAGIPATVSIGHIRPVSNFVPYFKIGAL